MGGSDEVSFDDDAAIDGIHTGFLYVVDDEGQLILTWPFGIPSEDIANDLEILLDQTT